MWLVYALIQSFLLALVNYIDEHLVTSNKLPKEANIHTKVGSVLLISTLMCFAGAIITSTVSYGTTLSLEVKSIALLSAVPMVLMYASYFYLLQTYAVHQVVPLFQISSIWLLLIELFFGGSITIAGLVGMLVLIYGAYILDSGTFKWKIPTKLLAIAVPATSTWAISLYMVRLASEKGSVTSISVWQLIGTGIIGALLFFTVKRYREGLLYRFKNQGKRFFGFSLANETFAEGGYIFSNLAVAVAPVAAYVTAMSGVQSLFVLILFFLFPLKNRAKVTSMQWIAVALIMVGVFLIEWK